MRVLFSIWLLAVSQMLYADGNTVVKRSVNAFVDGTVWEVCDGNLTCYYILSGVHEIDGRECLGLYVQKTRMEPLPETPDFYVFTEGDKVYFRVDSICREPTDKNWVLIIDFGLEPGEQCEVGVIDLYNRRIDTTVKGWCVCRYISDRFNSYPCSYIEFDGAPPACWLTGIGSAISPVNNCYVILGGPAPELRSVEVMGEQVIHSVAIETVWPDDIKAQCHRSYLRRENKNKHPTRRARISSLTDPNW